MPSSCRSDSLLEIKNEERKLAQHLKVRNRPRRRSASLRGFSKPDVRLKIPITAPYGSRWFEAEPVAWTNDIDAERSIAESTAMRPIFWVCCVAVTSKTPSLSAVSAAVSPS